jgi:hypothetical protein
MEHTMVVMPLAWSLILMSLLSLGHYPAYAADVITGPEALEEFFQAQKKKAPLELTLENGKVVKGLFQSYDDYYETVWMVPQGEPGMFTNKGYKLSGIRQVAVWDKKASENLKAPSTGGGAKPGKDDYYLLRESGL